MQYDSDFKTFDLNDFQTGFTKSETQAPDGKVPDGQYQVTIDQAELAESKASGKPMIKWTLRILGPSQRGRYLWKYSVFGDRNLGYIKGDLEIAGLKVEKLNDLNHRLAEVKNVKLGITKRTKGEFESIYFNERLLMDDDLGDDLDIPF